MRKRKKSTAFSKISCVAVVLVLVTEYKEDKFEDENEDEDDGSPVWFRVCRPETDAPYLPRVCGSWASVASEIPSRPDTSRMNASLGSAALPIIE
jgi:hypothetical protein